jgi:hypothetical protein
MDKLYVMYRWIQVLKFTVIILLYIIFLINLIIFNNGVNLDYIIEKLNYHLDNLIHSYKGITHKNLNLYLDEHEPYCYKNPGLNIDLNPLFQNSIGLPGPQDTASVSSDNLQGSTSSNIIPPTPEDPQGSTSSNIIPPTPEELASIQGIENEDVWKGKQEVLSRADGLGGNFAQEAYKIRKSILNFHNLDEAYKEEYTKLKDKSILENDLQNYHKILKESMNEYNNILRQKLEAANLNRSIDEQQRLQDELMKSLKRRDFHEYILDRKQKVLNQWPINNEAKKNWFDRETLRFLEKLTNEERRLIEDSMDLLRQNINTSNNNNT